MTAAAAAQALRQAMWRLDTAVDSLDACEERDEITELRRATERVHTKLLKLEARQDAERSA